MERDLQFRLIFNDKSFPIPINFYHYQDISQNILQTLIHDQKHQYEVQTNVPEEIFQSFVDYLVNNTISGINIENFYLYFQLCEEFEISDLISRNRLGFSDYLININGLQYCKSNFIPKIEEEIAQNLDEYLINSGEILMKSPIQSLHRIFKHKKRQLTNHDLAYELIKHQYENSHDPTIFILLDFLDGSQLTKNNLEESIKLAAHRFDFMPRIDFCYLTMQFKVLEERLEQMNKKVVENKKNHSNNAILYIMSFSLALLIGFLFKKINFLIETVSDQKNSIYYLNQKLFSFKEDISNLTKVITHHEEEMNNLTKVITHQKEEKNNLTRVIAHHEEDISNLTKVIAHHEEIISNITKVITHQKEEKNNLTRVIAHHEEDISNLTKVITHQKEVISNLIKVITHQEKDLSNLAIIITSLKEEIL